DDAVAIMRAAGFEPLEPYPGSQNPWSCLCTRCNRSIKPRYNEVTYRRRGCAYCSGKVVDTKDAVNVMLAAGLVPLGPYPGRNHSPWPCKCVVCGELVNPSYHSVNGGQGGCLPCGRKRAAAKQRRPHNESFRIM